MQNSFRTLCLTAFIVAAVTSAQARMAKSLSYELEYASINAGSADTTSADYGIVSIITTDGTAGEVSVSSGGAYTIEPLVGASDNHEQTSVQDWVLY